METTHAYNRFAIEMAEQDSFFSSVLSSSVWLLKCSNGKAFQLSSTKHCQRREERSPPGSTGCWAVCAIKSHTTATYVSICFRVAASPILPLLTVLSKTSTSWHGDAVLGKGHSIYNRSSQSKKAVVRLYMARLSTENHYNFVKLIHFQYLLCLL